MNSSRQVSLIQRLTKNQCMCLMTKPSVYSSCCHKIRKVNDQKTKLSIKALGSKVLSNLGFPSIPIFKKLLLIIQEFLQESGYQPLKCFEINKDIQYNDI